MEKKRTAINYSLVLIIIFLIFWEVIILNKHSTMGDMLTLFNRNIDKYENENNLLSQKIASSSSMITIAQKAQEYGLDSSSKIFALTSSAPLASDFKSSL